MVKPKTTGVWFAAAVGAVVLAGTAAPAPAQQILRRASSTTTRVQLVPTRWVEERVDSLIDVANAIDDRLRAQVERHYQVTGNAEKRVLEKRFGLIEHRFRIDADPLAIYRFWDPQTYAADIRASVLAEITEGRFSGYYFFDGVIRPNLFAAPAKLRGLEGPVHEKIHVVQPDLYRALGVRCNWKDPRGACVRSLEPVASYLTEFAILARERSALTEHSLNLRLLRHFESEVRRCRLDPPAPRCPSVHRVSEYIVGPQEIAGLVERYGLEDGLRRYIGGLGVGVATAARNTPGS